MTRPILYVPPDGGLFLVTTRTIQGRFLLRPSEKLNALAIGVMARAQRRYDVSIHAVVILSNHYHLLLSVENAWQLASFMNFVNGNLAKEAGRLHQWQERFWGRRYRATLVSHEPEAQIDRLRYVLAHGAQEGLVANPQDWPGVHSAQALTRGQTLEGRWIDRTRQYRARGTGAKESDFAEHENLMLEPIPCWSHLSDSKRRQRVQDLLAQIEEGLRASAEKRKNPPLPPTVHQIRRQHPHHRPARTKRSPAPRFHCFAKEVRKALTDAYRAFLLAYRSAARRLKQGQRNVLFPEGCFPPLMPFVPIRP